jgi:hypothetical protein
MHRRIHYSCKKCGWKGSIIEAWSDLKPKRCPNKTRCKTSFIKEPEQLLIELPEPEGQIQPETNTAELVEKDAGEVFKSEGAPKHGRNEKTSLSKRIQAS